MKSEARRLGRTILEKEGFDGLIEDMDRRIEGYMAR